MNKRIFFIALYILQCYIVLQASITDGVIFQIDGAKKANIQYNGYDLWIWDGNAKSLNISIYTNFVENCYYNEYSWYGSGRIAYNYPNLYCNDIFTGSSGLSVNQIGTFQHNGQNYSYLYYLTIDSTKLNQTYNKVHLQVTHGYQAGTTSSQPIYIAKGICEIKTNSTFGTTTGAGFYSIGETATLTATNSDCYSFQKWSDGNTDNPRSVVVTQDSTFTAFFVGTGYQELVKCTVVNESPYGTVKMTGAVAKDSTISLEAVAPECSKFVKWSDNDTSNPRELTVTKDSTLTAIFEQIEFNVSVDTKDAKKGKVIME